MRSYKYLARHLGVFKKNTMNFLDILQKRETTFTWSDEKVDKHLIAEILSTVVEHAPSKQNRRTVQIDILDWSNEQLRKDLFSLTHRDDDLTVEEDQGNPQMLAPVLLVFSPRETSKDLFAYESNEEMQTHKRNTHLEAGIISASCVYALTEAGYDTGYCKCWPMVDVTGVDLDGERDALLALQKKLKLPFEPILFVGVGYKGNEKEYFDPRINKNRPIPTHGVKPTPPKTEKVVIVRD